MKLINHQFSIKVKRKPKIVPLKFVPWVFACSLGIGVSLGVT